MALARRRWIASITSGCCASTASPRFLVQSTLSLIIDKDVGRAGQRLDAVVPRLLVDLRLERIALQGLVAPSASDRPARLPADRSMPPAHWPATRRDRARSAQPAPRVARASTAPRPAAAGWPVAPSYSEQADCRSSGRQTATGVAISNASAIRVLPQRNITPPWAHRSKHRSEARSFFDKDQGNRRPAACGARAAWPRVSDRS